MAIPLESPLGPNYLRVPDGDGGFTDRHFREFEELRQIVDDAAQTDGQCAVALGEARGVPWSELEPLRPKVVKNKRAYDPEVLDALEPLLMAACDGMAQRMVDSLRKRRDELNRSGIDHVRATGKLILRLEWYERRIEGLWETIGDVEVCGTVPQILRCQDCGHAWEGYERCEERLLCTECRDRAIWEERKLLDAELEDAENNAEPGWTRKHLVLTQPPASAPEHNVNGTPLEQAATVLHRVKLASSARAAFCRIVRDFLKARGQSWVWWAALEATAGDDDNGHVHWHILNLSPFLPDPLLAAWWGTAIEQRGGRAQRRTLGDALARLKKVSHGAYYPGYRRELVERASVPWTVPGVRAPRKKKGETASEYILRRARWASSCPVWPAKRRTLTKCYSSLRRQVPKTLGAELERVSTLPHAVVWIGSCAARPSAEIIKYTIKKQDMPPKLYAQIVLAKKLYRVRHFVSSKGNGLRKTEGDGCPGVLTDGTVCGSHRIKIERPEPDRGSQLSRLSRYLAGKPPEWLANCAGYGKATYGS